MRCCRRRPFDRMIAVVVVGVASGLAAARGLAVDAFEQPPISYSDTTPANPVADLSERLRRGEVALWFEDTTGYLKDLLASLRVPVSSQTLVFSKTSLQQRFIAPKNPRAIYFNDEVYVGYVRGGDVLEVSVADPQLGTVFYTVDQNPAQPPQFVRQTESCLICHGGSQTRGVPGHIVRSVYASRSGQPVFSAGSYRVDDTTPLADRWGGWYVTGTHGTATHLGNVTYTRRPEPGDERDVSGLNQTQLASRFDAKGYLSAHSDLVALSVLAHQAPAHTVLARASIEVRTALHREATLNRELGEPAGHRWPSTDSIIGSAVDSLVECLLFAEAAALPEPIRGTTPFAEEFVAAGPRDALGRSLRSLELESRLFRYPCSYLIYSASFDALPDELRQRFWQRMDELLGSAVGGENGSSLSPSDSEAIRQILAFTKADAALLWSDP